MADKKVCSKCGRARPVTEFFMQKDKERYPMCKDCLTQYIDNRDSSTFLWILEAFDVPYIQKKWTEICNDVYKKNPGKFGPKSVIGRYLRTMNMAQYQDYTFADSDKLNFQNQKTEQENIDKELQEKKEEELRQRLEEGEISQAEYNTLTSTNADQTPAELATQFIMPHTIDESYWTDQLTDEDIQYLMLKWGTVYNPEQWITMETMWNKYSNEYEMNVDREEVLKKMCKTSLKMDEALDCGDTTGYKSLATVFDQLRKSGKFTEAQNKEEKQQLLSTIGELVALCEREGGIIEALPQYDPHQYPQDKIDFTLKDLEAYTYNLVSKELGLGDLIESYIEKLEKAEEEEDDLTSGLITSSEEADKDKMTDEDYEEFNQFIENEIEEEAEELEKLLGLT